MQIVGTISRKALDAEIGPHAARSAVKQLKQFDGRKLVPRHDDLRVGDIILSRRLSLAGGLIQHPVETIQLQHGRSAAHSIWTHAMLYAGELHAVESNKSFSVFPSTAIKIVPLTRDCGRSDFLVLRFKDDEFSQIRRQHIARYALLSPSINPRNYDLPACWDAYRSHRPNGAKHLKRIFCSEFVLECFATAGPYLIDEYISLTDKPDNFYFPADFAADPRFDQLQMTYYQLDEAEPEPV
jgi:hypothetical protein